MGMEGPLWHQEGEALEGDYAAGIQPQCARIHHPRWRWSCQAKVSFPLSLAHLGGAKRPSGQWPSGRARRRRPPTDPTPPVVREPHNGGSWRVVPPCVYHTPDRSFLPLSRSLVPSPSSKHSKPASKPRNVPPPDVAVTSVFFCWSPTRPVMSFRTPRVPKDTRVGTSWTHTWQVAGMAGGRITPCFPQPKRFGPRFHMFTCLFLRAFLWAVPRLPPFGGLSARRAAAAWPCGVDMDMHTCRHADTHPWARHGDRCERRRMQDARVVPSPLPPPPHRPGPTRPKHCAQSMAGPPCGSDA